MLKNTDLKSLIIGFLLAMVIMLTVGATNIQQRGRQYPTEHILSGSIEVQIQNDYLTDVGRLPFNVKIVE